MKIFQILFLLLINLTFSQVKQFYSKEINPCLIRANDTLNYYYVKEKILKNNITIMIQTDISIDKKCSSQNIDYKKSFVALSKDTIKLNSDDFRTNIPQKIFLVRKNKQKYLFIELYNFSVTTVGNGYKYLISKNPFRNLQNFSVKETKFPLTKKEIATILAKDEIDDN